VILELPQKPQVILEEQGEAVNSMEDHRHPVKPEAKCPAGVFGWVDTCSSEDVWMDHSGTAHFQPAVAPLDGYFNAGFDKREVVGAKANNGDVCRIQPKYAEVDSGARLIRNTVPKAVKNGVEEFVNGYRKSR